MLVWQSGGEQRTDALHKTGARLPYGQGQARQQTGGWAWARPYERRELENFRHRSGQLSKRMRLALEYSIAILSALASSYLILHLGR